MNAFLAANTRRSEQTSETFSARSVAAVIRIFTLSGWGLIAFCGCPGGVGVSLAGLEPTVPDRVMAAPGDRQVSVSWAAATRAASYTIKIGTMPGGPFTTAVTGLTATAWIHAGLTNLRAYHYVVSAVNEHGESDNSAVVSVTPSAAVLDVLPAGAKVEKLAGGFTFIEGPVWVPEGEGHLIFSDINANRLIRWTPREGATTFRMPSGQANGNTLDAQGRLITCEHANRRVSRTEPNGTVISLVDRYNGLTLNAPNDVAVKSDGTVWFTDPNYGLGQTQPGRYVFRFHPSNGNATVNALITNFDQPNGICFSPDETKLYVADSGAPRHIRVFDVLTENTLSAGRVFTAINPGAPDGIRTDATGRLFSSAGDGVQIFGADGTLLGRLLTPEAPANLCFGGPGNQMLFITARTSLYGVTRLPDLIVTSIRRFPLSPRRGQAVAFSATVKNQGTGPTPAGQAVRVAFSIGGTNLVWSDNFIEALPPDASVVLTGNAGIAGPTWNAISGGHNLRAWVDDQDRILESVETNNVMTVGLSVAISPDSDGDGHDDAIENFAGTNPQDAGSVLRFLSSARDSADGIALVWACVPGKIYRVVCKGALDDLFWSDVAGPFNATNATMEWRTNLPPNARQVFFKVRVGP
jgi:gluconolactonase